MLKENVTPQEVCDLMNDLLKKDYECMRTIINQRVVCNDDASEHPTVQVCKYDKDLPASVGILGILNGIF